MQLPLFPLNTVLFPGGVLSLRVFETRYIDMVTQCLRELSTFGVCSLAANEAGGADGEGLAQGVGCEARILSCDAPQPNLLQIRVLGLSRFRIVTTETQANALLLAHIEPIAPDHDSELTHAHKPCANLLARVLLDLEAQTEKKRQTDATAEPPVLKPYQLNSSVWVGNRLCEVLQVPLKAKQKLMELDDASTRLDILTQYLKQHGVLK